MTTETKGKKILLIEDDEATARALRVLFHQRANLDVLWARTLADGRALLEEEPDCVLLDLMLPDGNGVELLEDIRERSQTTPRVVIVTAQTPSSPNVEKAIRLRPDAIFHKPYEIDVLLASLLDQTVTSGASGNPDVKYYPVVP